MSLLDRLLKEDKNGLYINGEWRPSSDGQRISVVDPATDTEPPEEQGEIELAVARARCPR